MLYSIYHLHTITSMQQFEKDELCLSQLKIAHLLDSIQAKKNRLETQTEISSNERDEDGSLSSCRQHEAADPKEAYLFNDAQKKLETQGNGSKEIENPHRIIRKGYLQKQTSSFLNRWQICYCVLTLSKLYFFQDDLMINLRSCINFTTLGASITREGVTLTVRLQEFADPIIFKGYSEQQVQRWQDDIGSIIQYHIHSSKVIFMQSKKYLYQEKDAITQKQFLEGAETGDLILMSTTDTQCAIQRFVTNSEYDHVGLIVRFNGEVKIFESNADDGVNIYSWAQFQNDFHQYQKMAIRKLYCQRKTQMQPVVMKFIKSSLGRNYDLTALKLMRKTSQDDQEPQRGYFCSELVAKVYKLFGLLEKEKASSNYWPVDFTSRGGLNLLDSASLGQERLIVLNKHLKYRS